MNNNNLIPPHGGFRKLRSFQCAQIVYDGTVIFCDRFIDKRSRTHDQMVQAARSGVQNIARASLGELLLDCEDFLRQKKMRQWNKDDPEALAVRGKFRGEKSDMSDRSDKSDLYRFSELTAEQLANTLICLINQASYLLWQQMKSLEKEFLEHGGFTERMYHTRKNLRKY